MTKLYVNLSNRPGEGAVIDVGNFFLGYGAALEEREQGYRLKIDDQAICMECGAPVLQTATYVGGGGPLGSAVGWLSCHCSSWECPASPMSGSAYVQQGFRRIRRWTKEERVQAALRSWGLERIE